MKILVAVPFYWSTHLPSISVLASLIFDSMVDLSSSGGSKKREGAKEAVGQKKKKSINFYVLETVLAYDLELRVDRISWSIGFSFSIKTQSSLFVCLLSQSTIQ